ncbi:Arc family DNA-binding protein [Rhizobium sp. KVB221]|uniref:Arc family DNA-binding protein n=1 Tax=Rhizobium setariae TaxID=2801340 RepID=A0A936YP01_9HYPH|nr:Arc family DNA-binding protein [Rhizobium setariae]MBL0374008.1 Arc family DNA-binding protein [Rhizobium setariae]
MAEEDEIRITLRLPVSLRDRLKARTDQSGRSMNAEIVARLESSFESNVDPKALAEAFAVVEEMRTRMDRQWEYIKKVEKEILDERRKSDEKLREKRQDLANYLWNRRARFREELVRKEESIENREARFNQRKREKEESLSLKEKELDEAIERFRAREVQLSEVIRSLARGADGLEKE